MDFEAYIANHQVFSEDEILAAVGPNAGKELSAAVTDGRLLAPFPGAYVSAVGSFAEALPYSDTVVAHLPGRNALAFLTALDFQSGSHNLVNYVWFYSDTVNETFDFQQARFVPVSFPNNPVETYRVADGDTTYEITTLEQTLVDCVDRPEYAAGYENLFYSIDAAKPLSAETLLRISSSYPGKVNAVLGWLLSLAVGGDSASSAVPKLRRRLSAGPFNLAGSGEFEQEQLVPEWNLVLPNPREEVESWVLER